MVKGKKASSEESYEHLLNMILTKKIMPGERIPELKIAEQLNVSRTPVRDAMKRLENEGLIEIFPKRFAQVKDYSIKEIQNIGAVRLALDTLAVRLASLHGSQLDFIKMLDLAKACERASIDGDLLLRSQADCDFHLALSNISKNSSLVKIQKSLYLSIQFIMIHHPNPNSDEKRQLKQHYELVQALSDHKESEAIAIITDHLASFYALGSDFPPGFFLNQSINPIEQAIAWEESETGEKILKLDK
ncbi:MULTISPECIES: GntR family transcriptional regulator [unclassified Enterococcus]|uniref:GntR family transcriptional regulator n=1 Tax=unclassified Enterococcus TaxID=2608891 RepID=UPI001552ED25|nr:MULTISPECIES: GntR family transcriptional regulator [unclassified Enterococcus]MBS7577895.1 GntR family transcriptional regulator [Enterococcus sp. MMGLQ5-2]MBS7585244.1 GntR family transcriptional regulator [Enterococcus sp. MMGLQ5-1]NPD13101.1 GntR family transcriptional regulator [Enterococcus sp. MMGLQ5-1]NPD37725.1 GntR family transcriptional regulator [Enterococcus sp. MMGLQ5-2]